MSASPGASGAVQAISAASRLNFPSEISIRASSGMASLISSPGMAETEISGSAERVPFTVISTPAPVLTVSVLSTGWTGFSSADAMIQGRKMNFMNAENMGLVLLSGLSRHASL